VNQAVSRGIPLPKWHEAAEPPCPPFWLSDLVGELVRLNVDVIVTHGTRAAKKATSTIPIVMAISGDAIGTGLVTSLARPEANVTGSTFFIPQLNAKRLELVKEVCPHGCSRGGALKSEQSREPTDHSSNAGRGYAIEVGI
jgi:hypothetical protein